MKPYWVLFLLSLFLGGCRYFVPDPVCPPPPSAKPPLTKIYSCVGPTVAPVLPEPCSCLSLAELVDLALQNSPKTRNAWFRAKKRAADLGVARGSYLPPINLALTYDKERFLVASQNESVALNETQIGPTLSTSYLLLDFGGRNNAVKAACYALTASNWTYNWEVQTVMIQVIQNYYTYINALAIVEADEETVKDNQTTYEAAKALTKGGIRNLSDELQAETNLLQSIVLLEQDRSFANIARAHLVQSLGISPDFPIQVHGLPERMERQTITNDVECILQTAKIHRADLMALRATVLENRAKIKIARSAFYPDVTTDLRYGQQWINGMGPSDVYSIIFNLNYSLFNSFNDVNLLKRAEASWQQAQAELDDEELQAFLVVLTDYYEFIANSEVLKYSEKYLEVATKNRLVAYENYLAGVTTIIDLMIANNFLSNARKQLANAKADWLSALANLSYDTGSLSIYAVTSEARGVTETKCAEIPKVNNESPVD